MFGRVLASALPVALALGVVGACGKTTTPKPQAGDEPSVSGAEFCEDLVEAFGKCSQRDAITLAECRQGVTSYDDSDITGARTCLAEPCNQLLSCVQDRLPKLGASVGPGTGGTTGVDRGACSGTAVKCVDSKTVQFCNEAGVLETVECKLGMAQEGILSNGCESDAAGDGCTVDGFGDVDCEAGASAFAVCAEMTEADLLDVYVACFLELETVGYAESRIACYGGYVNESDLTVDCGAAAAVCYASQK